MSDQTPYPPAPVHEQQPLQPQPAQPKTKNTIGLIALILAAVGFIFGVVPALSGLAWIFFIPAIVLAIIGLTRKGQRKGTSVAALVLAVVGWIIAIVVALVTVAGAIDTAIDESAAAPTAATQATEAAAEPAAPAESAEEAPADAPSEAAVGTTVTTDDGVAFTVTAIQCGLAEAGDNEFLKETARGQFCAVNYRIDNGSTDSINLSASDIKGYIGESAYDANTTVSTFGGELFATDVNPGLGSDNVVYIDIPAGAALEYIEFSPLFSFDSSVVVRAS